MLCSSLIATKMDKTSCKVVKGRPSYDEENYETQERAQNQKPRPHNYVC